MPLSYHKNWDGLGIVKGKRDSAAEGMNPQFCLEEGKLRKRPGNESSRSEGKLMMQSPEEKQV